MRLGQSSTNARQLVRAEFDHVGLYLKARLSNQRPSVSYKSPSSKESDGIWALEMSAILLQEANIHSAWSQDWTLDEAGVASWHDTWYQMICDVSIWDCNFYQFVSSTAHCICTHMKLVHLNPHKESRKVAPLWLFETHPAPTGYTTSLLPSLDGKKCMLCVRTHMFLVLLCLFRFEPFGSGTGSTAHQQSTSAGNQHVFSVSFSYGSDPAYKLQLESSTFSWTNLFVSRAWVCKPGAKPCPPATDRTTLRWLQVPRERSLKDSKYDGLFTSLYISLPCRKWFCNFQLDTLGSFLRVNYSKLSKPESTCLCLKARSLLMWWSSVLGSKWDQCTVCAQCFLSEAGRFPIPGIIFWRCFTISSECSKLQAISHSWCAASKCGRGKTHQS